MAAHPQVRQLMDDDGIEDVGRRQHEPPAEGEVARPRRRGPARGLVADGQAARTHVHLAGADRRRAPRWRAGPAHAASAPGGRPAHARRGRATRCSSSPTTRTLPRAGGGAPSTRRTRRGRPSTSSRRPAPSGGRAASRWPPRPQLVDASRDPARRGGPRGVRLRQRPPPGQHDHDLRRRRDRQACPSGAIRTADRVRHPALVRGVGRVGGGGWHAGHAHHRRGRTDPVRGRSTASGPDDRGSGSAPVRWRRAGR